MVAPHETGDLVRSLVRVTGSGRDRSLTPALVDLSNVSPLAGTAGTVQVSCQLPNELLQPSLQRQQQLRELNLERANENIIPNTSNSPRNSSVKRPAFVLKKEHPLQGAVEGHGDHLVNKETSLVEPPPPKKARLENKMQQQQGNPQPVLLQPARVVIVPQQCAQQQLRATPNAAYVLTPSHLKMTLERDALLKENATLQKKLALFQLLFRDKKRLASLLQRLGVKLL